MNILDYAIAKKLFGGSGSGEVSGTIDINANGTYNVAKYAHANVNVASSGGGESGVPIEVAELPTPTAEDVGKVYLNTTDGNYYVGDQNTDFVVGEPIGDKIYFDTSKDLPFNPAEGAILMAESGNAFITLQVICGELPDMGKMCLVMCQGEGADAFIMELLYVNCDVLTVEMFNEFLAPELGGMTVDNFGWQIDTDPIDTSAFANCVVTANDLSLWNNFAYGNSKTVIKRIHGDEINNLYGMVDGSITNITSNATSMRSHAFYNAKGLRLATFPNIEEIPESAFYQSGLMEIDAPNVTYIGRFGLARTAIAVADFPNVTRVGDEPFEYCSNLLHINFPKLQECSRICFECYNLRTITLGATPPKANSDPFYNSHQLIAIYVPAESVEAYKSATNWSKYADKIQAIVE